MQLYHRVKNGEFIDRFSLVKVDKFEAKRLGTPDRAFSLPRHRMRSSLIELIEAARRFQFPTLVLKESANLLSLS